MNETNQGVMWRRAARFEGMTYRNAKLREATEQFTVPRSGLARAIYNVGIPEVVGAATPKEDVIGLLSLAAEVEHALMVQYLYAAQSVSGVANRKISHVAIQEMGHLVTVNNLILSLMGVDAQNLPVGLHLGRDKYRKASSLNPLPFVLEPVTRKALAKFIVVERPGVIEDAALRARIEALEGELELDGVDANPVYALYAAIRWIFQETDTDSDLTTELGLKPGWHLKDTDFIAPLLAQEFAAEPIEWGALPGLIVAPVADRASGLHAIDAIAEQGEGADFGDESHFRDFLTVLDNFEADQFEVMALPRSPFLAELGESEDPEATEITATYTALWAKLFSTMYGLLLLDIGWGLSISRSNPNRRKMIDVSIETMRRLLQPTSEHLVGLPLADGADRTAGPTYQLADESLPVSRDGYATRFAVVIEARNAVLAKIQNHPLFPADITGFLVLSRIESVDLQRAPLLP